MWILGLLNLSSVIFKPSSPVFHLFFSLPLLFLPFLPSSLRFLPSQLPLSPFCVCLISRSAFNFIVFQPFYCISSFPLTHFILLSIHSYLPFLFEIILYLLFWMCYYLKSLGALQRSLFLSIWHCLFHLEISPYWLILVFFFHVAVFSPVFLWSMICCWYLKM